MYALLVTALVLTTRRFNSSNQPKLFCTLTALTEDERLEREPATLTKSEFLARLEEYFVPHRERENARIDKDKKIYGDYLQGGLSQIAYCNSVGMGRKQLQGIFVKYDVPSAMIDATDRKKVLRKLKRSKLLDALLCCSDPNCYGTKLLRQILSDDKPRVD